MGTRRWAAIPLALVALIVAGLAPATPVGAEDARPMAAVLVVETAPDSTAAEAAVARVGGRVDRQLRIIDGFRATVPVTAVSALRAERSIRSVAADRLLRVQAAYGEGSGDASAVYVDSTRATKAWSMGARGQRVNVAVIDTGVDTSGDLAGRVVHSEDFTAEQNHADSYGHGTFVAGMIAGSGAGSNGAITGEAPEAGIVSLKIAGRDGTTDVTRVLMALEWVVMFKDVHDVRVVNLSLGYDSTQPATVDPLNLAVQRVWNRGIVVVVAAGNGGNLPGTVTKPGDDPLVITVGASNDRTTPLTGDDRLAYFSASGPTVEGVAKPDVLAPGRSVVSSRSPGSAVDEANPSSRIGERYARGSGTSFSAAVVSGAAAVILSRTPSLTPNQVKGRLMAEARPLSGGPTPATGSGVVDVFNAAFTSGDPVANAGAVSAVGGGSLQATRGSSCVRGEDGLCLSDADADAVLGFDAAAYLSSEWAGSQWAGSQWAGSQWADAQWTDAQWTGSQWAGSQWAGSQWAGSQWAGSQWAGSQWAGAQWAAAPWAAIEEAEG